MDDALGKRGANLEEEYFHRKEKELIEKMREKTARAAELKLLSEAMGVPDEEVIEMLRDLGYTRETIVLIHLVPLIQVGWADGTISGPERELLFEAARLRNVNEGSPAYQQLETWLESRPSDEFFEKHLRIVTFLSKASGPNTPAPDDLFNQALQVAEASGGILGFGKVSGEEKALLERIAKALGKG